MAAEKKAKQEIEELKAHIRKMQEAERKERRKLAEEDAIKKIKKNEELIADLQKNLTAQKQVKLFTFRSCFVKNVLLKYTLQLIWDMTCYVQVQKCLSSSFFGVHVANI